MFQKDPSTTQPIHPASVGKRMLQGAGIAFLLMAIFLLRVKNPDPAWGTFWMIKPLLMVPFSGAMGGVFYYNMDHFRHQGGWKKVLAYLISLIVYIIGVWMGTVLGLNGTLWD